MSHTLVPEQTDHAQAEPEPVRLKIENGLHEIAVKLDEPVYLGRSDEHQEFPVIDMAGFGGTEKGVSRRHAKLSKRDGTVIIEDLGSRNGTFVNARNVTPYTAITLNDGDYLHLGLLLIQILIN